MMKCRELVSNDALYAAAQDRPFNSARLHELEQALGAGKLDRLLAMAGQEFATRPAVIEQALAELDLSRAAHESHALAGAALSIGASATGFAARLLESALRTGVSAGDEVLPALLQLREAARQAAEAVPAIRCALRDTPRLAA